MKSREAKLSYMRQYKARNRERLLLAAKTHRETVRREVLTYYGLGVLACGCCGEMTYEFLSIDHMNGGGSKHRRELGSKYIYSFLKQNWPDGYQVLCHNCNMAKGFYGICPHQKEPDNEKTIVQQASSFERVEDVNCGGPEGC